MNRAITETCVGSHFLLYNYIANILNSGPLDEPGFAAEDVQGVYPKDSGHQNDAQEYAPWTNDPASNNAPAGGEWNLVEFPAARPHAPAKPAAPSASVPDVTASTTSHSVSRGPIVITLSGSPNIPTRYIPDSDYSPFLTETRTLSQPHSSSAVPKITSNVASSSQTRSLSTVPKITPTTASSVATTHSSSVSVAPTTTSTSASDSTTSTSETYHVSKGPIVITLSGNPNPPPSTLPPFFTYTVAPIPTGDPTWLPPSTVPTRTPYAAGYEAEEANAPLDTPAEQAELVDQAEPAEPANQGEPAEQQPEPALGKRSFEDPSNMIVIPDKANRGVFELKETGKQKHYKFVKNTRDFVQKDTEPLVDDSPNAVADAPESGSTVDKSNGDNALVFQGMQKRGNIDNGML